MTRVGAYTLSFLLAEEWPDVRESLARQLVGGNNYELTIKHLFGHYSHFPNCGCDEIPDADISVVKRRYFAFRDSWGKLVVSDIHEEFDNEFFDPRQPTSLKSLALLNTQILYRRWVKTKGILNYHYAQFRDLVEELVTTDLPLRVPRSLAKLLLPSLVEPYFEHREVIPGKVPQRVGRTWIIWHPPGTTRGLAWSFGVSPHTPLDACFLWWDKILLNQWQWWSFVFALIVEKRIPSTRQSLAILFAVDRYCGNRQEVWWAKDDPEIRRDISRLFCVRSGADIDHFLRYILDNGATAEEIQERRRDLARGNEPPPHWLPEALAGVRE